MTFRLGRWGWDELEAIKGVLQEGSLSSFYRNPYGGKWVQKFERAFAEWLGVKHAISVCNGTAALHTAYLACGIKSGDEIISTPLTFVSTVTMGLACGAKVIFADVDPQTYNIDPESVKELITPKTKAIVPVHLIGQCADMKALCEIAEDNDLMLIEDACQGLGSEFDGRKAGTFGDCAVFSFQETKQLTTGEGGMIVTNDDEIAEKCRRIRNNAAKYFMDTEFFGYNYRLSEMQAAMGFVQLSKLDMFIEREIQNAEYSIKKLPDAITPPFVHPNTTKHTYYIVGCIFDEKEAGMSRDEFLERVNEKGLNELRPGRTVSGGYSEVIYHLPYFQKHRDCWRGKCPNAEELPKKWLWYDWPRYPSTKRDMDRLIDGFNEILELGS